LSALAGVLLSLGFVPASQAVEILRWERLPLPVPLVVGQERVVFIDRNVRIGVPASVGDHLRVQSAGGAIYLRASEADSAHAAATAGRGIRRADPARHRRRAGEGRPGAAGTGAHRGSGSPREALRRRCRASGADEQADAPADKSPPGAKRRYRSC
jgi:hypothetical protein